MREDSPPHMRHVDRFGPFYDVPLRDLPSILTQGPIVPFTRTSSHNHTETRPSIGEKVESDINFLAVDYVQLAILPQDKADHDLALGEMTTVMKTLTQHKLAVRESQSRRTEINRRVIDDGNDIKDYMKNLLRKIHEVQALLYELSIPGQLQKHWRIRLHKAMADMTSADFHLTCLVDVFLGREGMMFPMDGI